MNYLLYLTLRKLDKIVVKRENKIIKVILLLFNIK